MKFKMKVQNSRLTTLHIIIAAIPLRCNKYCRIFHLQYFTHCIIYFNLLISDFLLFISANIGLLMYQQL